MFSIKCGAYVSPRALQQSRPSIRRAWAVLARSAGGGDRVVTGDRTQPSQPGRPRRKAFVWPTENPDGDCAIRRRTLQLTGAAGFLVFPASVAALGLVKSPALACTDLSLACCKSCFLAYFQPRRVLPDQSPGVPYAVSG